MSTAEFIFQALELRAEYATCGSHRVLVTATVDIGNTLVQPMPLVGADFGELDEFIEGLRRLPPEVRTYIARQMAPAAEGPS